MRAWPWAGALVAAVVTGQAVGQQGEDLSLARTYGSGVHAYFSADYDRSYDDLTAVIAAGSEDPRSRYFRGLSALRLGRLDEAEADFTEGAELEARALGAWPVSRSLERVQGHDRIRLERHRVRARIASLERDREAERKRYSGIEVAQPDVQRSRRPSPAAESGVLNEFDEELAPAALPAPPAAGGETPAATGPAATAEPAQGEMTLPPADSSSTADGPAAGTAEAEATAAETDTQQAEKVEVEKADPAATPAVPEPPAEDPFGDKLEGADTAGESDG